eukprot:TRINITY_DN59766_c0_g1_i1.p3 TRINITY_DN59766_c0_g1~~TRINITY_DN59766_c0_g1_i1.p3  ORF type:complete len:145 (-),score=8.11 TRINITY_DN59766_c0_g1_i1:210-644(-)
MRPVQAGHWEVPGDHWVFEAFRIVRFSQQCHSKFTQVKFRGNSSLRNQKYFWLSMDTLLEQIFMDANNQRIEILNVLVIINIVFFQSVKYDPQREGIVGVLSHCNDLVMHGYALLFQIDLCWQGVLLIQLQHQLSRFFIDTQQQ